MKHLSLIKDLEAKIARGRANGLGEMAFNLKDIESVLQEGLRSAVWAAQMSLELGGLSSRVDDVQRAVIPHPKFKDKTALVWRSELDDLFFENYSARYPARVPQLEEAKKMYRLLELLDKISEDAELQKRFEDVSTELRRIYDSANHPTSAIKEI